jgi:RHS repeat-associated protein
MKNVNSSQWRLIRSFACMAGCCLVPVLLKAQPVSYAPLFTAATFNRTLNLDLPVGVIEGAHGVSTTGAATYALPIKVAPGTNGMAPVISVNYNSQTGNGLCGWGWGLSGISAISRTGRNYWNDEKVEAVTLTNNDAFALDGSRLTPLTGNNGADNTVYGAEAETYAQITSHATMGGGPQYFKVWMKNGSVVEYGNTPDARVLTNSGTEVLAWKVNKVMDANGNYTTFHYTTSGGEHRIDEICYTGNANAGITPYNHLKFEYQLREDKNTVYESGNAFQSRYLLTAIKSFADNQLVHSYTLAYGTDQLYSFLQEVTECGVGNQCLNSTRFKYGDEMVAGNELDAEVAPGIFQGLGGGQNIITGDFNGDGYTDIIQFWKHLDVPSNIIYTDSFKVKLKSPYSSSFSTSYVYNLPGDYQVINRVNIPNGYNYHASDFDGDGADDILLVFRKIYSTGTELDKILIFTKLDRASPVITPYTPAANFARLGFQPNCVYPGDFDGDGRMDFITVASDGVRFKSFVTSPGKGYANEPVVFNRTYQGSVYDSYLGELAATTTAAAIDFDGNGRQDLFFVESQTLNQPNSYSYVLNLDRNSNGTWTASTLYTSGYPSQWHNIWFGDFNGDRKTDLLTRTNDTYQWEMAISDGKQYQVQNFNFEKTPAVYQAAYGHVPLPTSDDLLLLNDFNGDGKTDILHGSQYWSGPTSLSGNYTMYYSRGDRAMNLVKINTRDMHGFWYFSGDFNGDGKADFISHRGGSSDYELFTFRSGASDRLLHKINDGFGNTTIFSHSFLTDKYVNNYTWSGNAPYPFNNIMSPMYCVRSVAVPDGNGGIRKTSYSYGNARFHKAGKGFLGFSEFVTKDNSTGFETRQSMSFDQSFFLPQQAITTVSNSGQDISRSRVSYLNTDLGNKRYKQEVTGTYSEDLLAATWASTSATYDVYGNPVKTISNHFNIETVTVATQYTPANVTGTPVPALPSLVSTTLQRQGAPSIVEEQLFNYHPNGLLSKRMDFHSLPNQMLTTYTYNGTGQVIQEKVNVGSNIKTVSYAYDPKGRFLIQKTNALGQQELMSYDNKWGVVTEAKGIDQVRATFNYDAFGRLTETILPNYSIVTSMAWRIDPAVNGLYQSTTSCPGKPTVTDHKDALGRSVRTLTENWYQAGGSPAVSLFSEVITKYDARGNVSSVTEPHYAGESDYLTTISTYDWLNRPQRSCDNLHGCTGYAYNYSNGKLTTTLTKSSGQYSSVTKDATGKTVNTTDNGGSVTLEYNSRGQQTKAIPNFVNSAVETTYDEYGRQRSLKDPNAGTTEYDYNVWGEMISQKDANGNQHTMLYDMLGRLTARSGPEGNTQYVYYNGATAGEGNKLKSVTDFNGNSMAYRYDALGRMASQEERINSKLAKTSYGYDLYDRLIQKTYENVQGGNVMISNEYTGFGALKKVLYNGISLYEATGVNSKGLLVRYNRNNGTLPGEHIYNYGYLVQKSSAGIQDYKLGYDYPTGNIIYREDALKKVKETFIYDNLDRLTNSAVAYFDNGSYISATPVNITYQGSAMSNGNIISKGDVGTYSYGVKPHAVTYVSDAGNIIPHTQQEIKYTPFQKTASIEEGLWKQTYQYGEDYERRLSALYKNAVLTEQRYYFNGAHEVHRDVAAATEKDIIYVPGGDGICAIIEKNDVGEQVYFPFSDHLGSIQSLVNTSSTIVYEQQFDAWGRYRDTRRWTALDPYYTPVPAFSWVRGFTGHEHLPQFALINMNGRVYDPVLGRMLSPDNYIQAPEYTQSYNRYSYCWNNPVRYTDPSGNMLGAMFFASAFLGELGSNLVHGTSRPFAAAYSSAQNASSEIGNLGQVPVYQSGNTTITAGLDIFGLGVSTNIYYQDGDFSAHAGVGVGLIGGPSANAGISQRLHLGSTDYLTLGVGAGTNFKTFSVSGSASYTNAGYSLGYGYNYYGGASGNGYGKQYTGTLSIGMNDFHVAHENDFLAFGNEGDKFRTAGFDMGVGVFSVGAKMHTNDPLKEPGNVWGSNYRGLGESNIWGINKSSKGYTTWGDFGKVFSAPLWLQYSSGSSISRIGYSAKAFQDFPQNGIHQSTIFPPGNQNYYINYAQFFRGAYFFSGHFNQSTIYGF